MTLTSLSIPSRRSMKKNKMAHKVEIGIWQTASGYAMKARPGPTKVIKNCELNSKCYRMLQNDTDTD